MADRGRKSRPCGNHLVQTRFEEYCMRIHHERLAQMSRTPVRCKTMDNTVPASMQLSHLKTRGKKRQMEKEWKERVERDNYNLLAKMERIMNRSISNITKPATYRTSMSSSTRQSGVALDPTQYPYVDCILKEPHAPIKRGKGHERATAAKKVIAENHKMLYRIRDAKPLITVDEHMGFEVAQNKYRDIARKPEIARLSNTLTRQTAPAKSLALASGSSSLVMSSMSLGRSQNLVIAERPAFDTTPFNPKTRPKTSSAALVPSSQLRASQSQPLAGARPSTGADRKYEQRLNLMYNTGRPFGARPDSYASGPQRINTKITEATPTAFSQPRATGGSGSIPATPGERARARALLAEQSAPPAVAADVEQGGKDASEADVGATAEDGTGKPGAGGDGDPHEAQGGEDPEQQEGAQREDTGEADAQGGEDAGEADAQGAGNADAEREDEAGDA